MKILCELKEIVFTQDNEVEILKQLTEKLFVERKLRDTLKVDEMDVILPHSYDIIAMPIIEKLRFLLHRILPGDFSHNYIIIIYIRSIHRS